MSFLRARAPRLVLLATGVAWSGLSGLHGCQRLNIVDDSPPVAPFTTGASSGSGGSAGDPDPDPIFECDPIAQDCLGGQKCTAVSVSGVRNRYVCVDDSGALGRDAACAVADSTGVDGCRPGLACVATEDGAGTCQPLCLMDADCPGGRCTRSPDDGLLHCGETCDPFGTPCAPPLECRPFQDEFVCQVPRADDTGVTLFPCSLTDGHGCGLSYVCVTGTLLPGCNQGGCCTPLCDLTTPDPHGACQTAVGSPSVSCVGYTSAPSFDHVGACMIPF